MIQVSKLITLKQIQLEDSDTLSSLMNEIYPPVYNYLWTDNGRNYLKEIYSYQNIEKDLREYNSSYFFVCYQAKIIGILKLKKLEEEQIIFLQRIYLHSKHQGKGIGKALFNWIIKTYKSDFSKLSLEVMASETKAIRFYEKMGMKPSGNSTLNFKSIKTEFKQILIYQKHIK